MTSRWLNESRLAIASAVKGGCSSMATVSAS
jgi:hypothetical protein